MGRKYIKGGGGYGEEKTRPLTTSEFATRRGNFPDRTHRNTAIAADKSRAARVVQSGGRISKTLSEKKTAKDFFLLLVLSPPKLFIPKTPSPFGASSPHPRYYSSRAKCFPDYTTRAPPPSAYAQAASARLLSPDSHSGTTRATSARAANATHRTSSLSHRQKATAVPSSTKACPPRSDEYSKTRWRLKAVGCWSWDSVGVSTRPQSPNYYYYQASHPA